jgi:hypothetical protein
VILPEPVAAVRFAVRLVAEVVLIVPRVVLKRNLSLIGLVSIFVPEIVIGVPAAATVGVKLVTVGSPFPDVTVKLPELVAVPLGDVTWMGPVVAPVGTVVKIWLVVAELTIAFVPLKLTVFCPAVLLKAVPLIVIAVPTGPLFGVKSIMEIWPTGFLEIETRFPMGSYL